VIPTFWNWFIFGAGNTRPGWRLMLNGWLIWHVAVGTALFLLIPATPYEFAGKALFPAASILVGMAVAWTSRAAAVLQDEKFRSAVISDYLPIEAYLYGYQLSLLIIISMVIFVTITANGGLTLPIGTNLAQTCTGITMYFLLSMAMRECWTVINFSNLLSILHSKVPAKPKS
jgi:hypothetical protein